MSAWHCYDHHDYYHDYWLLSIILDTVMIVMIIIIFIIQSPVIIWATLVAQTVKSLSAMQDTQVWSLGREDPLKKGMTAHSNILVWRIPWTEEPGGLQSMGSQRDGHDWHLHFHDSLVGLNRCVNVKENRSLFQIHFPFMGPKWTLTFLLMFHWLELSHMTTPSYKGGWEMESTTLSHTASFPLFPLLLAGCRWE